MKSAALLSPLLIASVVQLGRADEYVPPAVEECLNRSAVKSIAELVFDANPFYLRGHFDGDGKPDYANAVRGRADKPLRPPFSDMPGDNFVAPDWEVFTKADLADLKRFDTKVPNPVPRTIGEAVAMIWEDGIALIYWNGARFLWAGSKNK